MTMCFKCQIKQDGAADAFSLLWRGLWFTVKTLYIQKRDQVDDNINHHYIYHGYAWYELPLHIKEVKKWKTQISFNWNLQEMSK